MHFLLATLAAAATSLPLIAVAQTSAGPGGPVLTGKDAFGGWDKAQAEHFDDGGIFDKIYQPGK